MNSKVPPVDPKEWDYSVYKLDKGVLEFYENPLHCQRYPEIPRLENTMELFGDVQVDLHLPRIEIPQADELIRTRFNTDYANSPSFVDSYDPRGQQVMPYVGVRDATGQQLGQACVDHLESSLFHVGKNKDESYRMAKDPNGTHRIFRDETNVLYMLPDLAAGAEVHQIKMKDDGTKFVILSGSGGEKIDTFEALGENDGMSVLMPAKHGRFKAYTDQSGSLHVVTKR